MTTELKQLRELEARINKDVQFVDADLPKSWPKEYATNDKAVASNRKVRQEVLRDWIAQQGHHTRFASCINNIENLDVEGKYAHVELAKWSKAAELHLRAMNKYIPDVKAVQIDVTDEAKVAAEGVSRAAAILERIAGSRLSQDNERALQERSVVSSQICPEEEGSGAGPQT